MEEILDDNITMKEKRYMPDFGLGMVLPYRISLFYPY